MTTPGHTFSGECLSRIYAQLDAANAAPLHINPVRPSGTVTRLPPRLRSVGG